ncbi:hypothetical protein TB1_041782 [Malus domestica]
MVDRLWYCDQHMSNTKAVGSINHALNIGDVGTCKFCIDCILEGRGDPINNLSDRHLLQANYCRCHFVLDGFVPRMPQKTVVSVELLCSKCRKKVMKLIATVEGITSIVLDPSKNTVTVTGDADPVKIIGKVRKFRKNAMVVSIGPPQTEKKDEKKDVPYTPKVCQRCDVWYVIAEDGYSYCSIM